MKNIIPIASGKGGVGKSTVSANLALALSQSGLKVGLMDADVYGPSVPTILGIKEKPTQKENRIIPVERLGIKVISMGFFIAANEAVIWRGPMLHKMVNDFLKVVDWGDIDTLVVDLPPGTGDIQLSLCQTIPVTGAVIISTPQEVAWNVAQKAIVMFDKLNAPVLGIIENMSVFTCSECGHNEEIFGHGGARRAAEILGIPFLGEIPLVTQLRESSDKGLPIVCENPKGAVSQAFFELERLKRSADAKVIPKKIGPPNQSELLIEWSDGSLGVYSAKKLRLACPCAGCVDEITGEKILRAESVPGDVRPTSINPVGRYALQIQWSDGHNTGLYSFELIRNLP
jgi:ATP-binding protein involved in chromosome partitioning